MIINVSIDEHHSIKFKQTVYLYYLKIKYIIL